MPKGNRKKVAQKRRNTSSRNHENQDNLTEREFDQSQGSIKLFVPAFFIDKDMLGNEKDNTWDQPQTWQIHYNEQYHSNQNTIAILGKSFWESSETDIPDQILCSLHSPCARLTTNQIAWKFNTKPLTGNELKNREKKGVLKGEPYSILSILSKNGKIKQNIIFDHNGFCRFAVDFETHGSGDVHWHILQPGSRAHKPGEDEDHAHHWRTCPWIWLAIPTHYGPGPDYPAEKREHETIEIHYDPTRIPSPPMKERVIRNVPKLVREGSSLAYDYTFGVLMSLIMLLIFYLHPSQRKTTVLKSMIDNKEPYAKSSTEDTSLELLKKLHADLPNTVTETASKKEIKLDGSSEENFKITASRMHNKQKEEMSDEEDEKNGNEETDYKHLYGHY